MMTPLGMSGSSRISATEEVETVAMVITGGPGGASKVEIDMFMGRPGPHPPSAVTYTS